jgi:methyl-accepting chemotaxis protein
VKKVSDIVAEIAAASREQSAGIEQVNTAVMQMDELTQQNAALVEQATAASQSMADQARGLTTMMRRYRIGDASESTVQSGTAEGTEVALASRGERRGPKRPFASKPGGPAKRPASPRPAVQKLDKAVGAGDSDWTEF